MSIDKLKTKFFTGAWLTDVKHYFTKINEIIDYLNGIKGEGSYKVYTALLTQTGTDAPTARILENTLGEEPIWSYNDVGTYNLTFQNSTLIKVFTQITNLDGQISNGGGVTLGPGTSLVVASSTVIRLLITDNLGSTQNGALIDYPIEIRVYN